MAEAGFRVTGLVQGVGFRWWVRAQAAKLGLAGTVRNATDGSVEVQARGSEHALAELERLLSEGPLHAQVRAVDRIPVALPSSVDGFEIVR
ncbi:MAG TPA: acylphosphatase [Longimicrobiaceae bacterium]